jgi:hypothetical protein
MLQMGPRTLLSICLSDRREAARRRGFGRNCCAGVRPCQHQLELQNGDFRTLRPYSSKSRLLINPSPRRRGNYPGRKRTDPSPEKTRRDLEFAGRSDRTGGESGASHRPGSPRRDRAPGQTRRNRRGLRGQRLPVPISEWRPSRIHRDLI